VKERDRQQSKFWQNWLPGLVNDRRLKSMEPPRTWEGSFSISMIMMVASFLYKSWIKEFNMCDLVSEHINNFSYLVLRDCLANFT
jgi:hypothetical protein